MTKAGIINPNIVGEARLLSLLDKNFISPFPLIINKNPNNGKEIVIKAETKPFLQKINVNPSINPIITRWRN